MNSEIDAFTKEAKDLMSTPKRPKRAPQKQLSAYRLFLRGCEAEEAGKNKEAESFYKRAIMKEGALAAAHTNLGNLFHKQGKLGEAREQYEKALESEPRQCEARYNLGNVLDDLGETELAIAEMRRVCNETPRFASAHYNLGLILKRLGGLAQAKDHFQQYLTLCPDTSWSHKAKAHLAAW